MKCASCGGALKGAMTCRPFRGVRQYLLSVAVETVVSCITY